MQFPISSPRTSRRSSNLLKVLTTLGLVIVLGAIAASSAVAAFRPSTSAQHFTSEGIQLESDSSGHAMFEAPAMGPGETVTSQTEISYTGDAPAEIHLYGTTTGTRFARSLHLEVSREGETLYRGTLAKFPDSYEHGVVDPHTWGGSTSATYRFDVTLMERAAPQDGGASQTFTWEARSV